MFVRFKKRALSSSNQRNTDYSIRFVVVKSYRKDGQPRQRIVKYLGSIRESELRNAAKKRDFLHSMQKRLSRAGFSPVELASLNLSLINCIMHF